MNIILIELEGGLIQNVSSIEPVHVYAVDYDTDGTPDSSLITRTYVEQGYSRNVKFYGSTYSSQVDPPLVQEFAKLIDNADTIAVKEDLRDSLLVQVQSFLDRVKVINQEIATLKGVTP